MDVEKMKPTSSMRSAKRKQQRAIAKERSRAQENSLSQTVTSVLSQTENDISMDIKQLPKVVSPLAKVTSEQVTETSTKITRNLVHACGRLMSKYNKKESILCFRQYKLSQKYPDNFVQPPLWPDLIINDSWPSDIHMASSPLIMLLSSDTLMQHWYSINPPIEETDSEESTEKFPTWEWTPTTFSWDRLNEIMHDMQVPFKYQLIARHMQCELVKMGKGPPQTKPQSNNPTVTTTVEAEESVLPKVEPIRTDFTNTGARPKTQQTSSTPIKHMSELPHDTHKVVGSATQNLISIKETVSPIAKTSVDIDSENTLFTIVEAEEMRNNADHQQLLEDQFGVELQNIQLITDKYQRELSAEIGKAQVIFQQITHNYQRDLSAQIGQAQAILAEISQFRIKQRDATEKLCQLFDESMQFTQNRD